MERDYGVESLSEKMFFSFWRVNKESRVSIDIVFR